MGKSSRYRFIYSNTHFLWNVPEIKSTNNFKEL